MTSAEPLRPALARELLARAERSTDRWARHVRNQLDGVQLGRGRHDDHANARVLRRIVAEHAGWPGHRLLGSAAARAAWLIALHADDDPDFQRTAAHLLRQAVMAHDAPAHQWAHLHDRALANSRQPQEFGTQYRVGPGGLAEPYPVRDAADLDTRRAVLGLPPADIALAALRERLVGLPGSADASGDVLNTLAGAA
ncbi:DUF6624 domain-containing protein [Streptomyces sp. NPDC002671]